MLGNLTAPQLYFLAVLIIAFTLFLTEWIRNDVVALLIVLALYVTGILKPTEALSGFSSEPAIVVAAIFVLSAALHHTGLSDTLGAWIGWLAGRSYTGAIAVIMPSVALLSAFTHHVTTTAVMLPVTLDLSREKNIPASKLLIPVVIRSLTWHDNHDYRSARISNCEQCATTVGEARARNPLDRAYWPQSFASRNYFHVAPRPFSLA